ncbi:hypothetical protein O9G_002168 [Rozella allomycis CSF55]|uniref:Ankyrin n=1 Tax=Rozella allomycis (strain CSF55) TaxID=988480 RepID=A0A075AUC2_ROZAC|nr:hypothetical protein O9G_002168 [Rozella allomycis CSF55]|eukprot:EPZ32327.1 hypothetical protein O9G_002168 [Rozella allomycis CSF55]
MWYFFFCLTSFVFSTLLDFKVLADFETVEQNNISAKKAILNNEGTLKDLARYKFAESGKDYENDYFSSLVECGDKNIDVIRQILRRQYDTLYLREPSKFMTYYALAIEKDQINTFKLLVEFTKSNDHWLFFVSDMSGETIVTKAMKSKKHRKDIISFLMEKNIIEDDSVLPNGQTLAEYAESMHKKDNKFMKLFKKNERISRKKLGCKKKLPTTLLSYNLIDSIMNIEVDKFTYLINEIPKLPNKYLSNNDQLKKSGLKLKDNSEILLEKVRAIYLKISYVKNVKLYNALRKRFPLKSEYLMFNIDGDCMAFPAIVVQSQNYEIISSVIQDYPDLSIMNGINSLLHLAIDSEYYSNELVQEILLGFKEAKQDVELFRYGNDQNYLNVFFYAINEKKYAEAASMLSCNLFTLNFKKNLPFSILEKLLIDNEFNFLITIYETSYEGYNEIKRQLRESLKESMSFNHSPLFFMALNTYSADKKIFKMILDLCPDALTKRNVYGENFMEFIDRNEDLIHWKDLIVKYQNGQIDEDEEEVSDEETEEESDGESETNSKDESENGSDEESENGTKETETLFSEIDERVDDKNSSSDLDEKSITDDAATSVDEEDPTALEDLSEELGICDCHDCLIHLDMLEAYEKAQYLDLIK